MKLFGRFTARPGIKEKKEDERFTYYENAGGIEWDDFFKQPENKAAWYLALTDNGQICCAERDPLAARNGFCLMAGVDSIAPYTNAEGGTIYGCRLDLETGEILPPPPAPLSAMQIRLWLLARGKTDEDVAAAIAGFKSPLKEQAQIKWQYAVKFERDSQFIKDLAKAMGWSDAWLDTEWKKAAQFA